jgi:preprotein translocase subunit SecG
MEVAFSIIEIVLSVVIIALVLMQSKGADLGGFLGGGSTGELGGRTRRGVELLTHRITIVTSIIFFLVTAVTFFLLG